MFHPGQEVECIVDIIVTYNPYLRKLCAGISLPKKGQRFTVRWCGTRPTDSGQMGVMLNELVMPKCPDHDVEVIFGVDHFRAIVRTDISVFEKLRSPRPAKERELIPS